MITVLDVRKSTNYKSKTEKVKNVTNSFIVLRSCVLKVLIQFETSLSLQVVVGTTV